MTRRRASHAALRPLVPVVLAALAGCDEYDQVTGVLGHPTHEYGQAETAIAVTTPASGPPKVVVAYNDETYEAGTYVLYNGDHSERAVQPGASFMGWSYSTDAGSTWSYGAKLRPPAGWAALWGDPSIDSRRITIADFGPYGGWYLYDWVALTSIAAPSYRMTGPVTGSMGDVLDGACVALSTDGGATFSIHQCFAEEPYDGDGPLPNQHFYDGSATAMDDDGDLCVAFHDVSGAKISVWCGNPVWGVPLSRVPVPGIPGSGSLTHPRLAFAGGELYLVVQRGTEIFVTKRGGGGGWTAPLQVSHPGAVVPRYPELHLPLPLRTGPQFDFAIGPASSAGYDEVRVLYAYENENGHLGMATSFCPASLSACYYDPDWWTDPEYPAEYFNPRIAVAPPDAWGDSIWKVAFDADMLTGTNAIAGRVGTLTAFGLNRLLLHYELVPPREVCADDRGYWGDYDDMKFVELENGSPQFIVTGTDSTNGCGFRDHFLSHHVHVGSVLFK